MSSSRKRHLPVIGDLESGNIDALLKNADPFKDIKGSHSKDNTESTYTPTVIHKHIHEHNLTIGSGVDEVIQEPYSEFSITTGLQCFFGWIMCAFFYIIFIILVVFIVELST